LLENFFADVAASTSNQNHETLPISAISASQPRRERLSPE
jgi:hypothetical protein